jgi:hypothetical protein
MEYKKSLNEQFSDYFFVLLSYNYSQNEMKYICMILNELLEQKKTKNTCL